MVPFPEDRFPPAKTVEGKYQERVARGYRRLKQLRIAVWGLARDLGQRLEANTIPLVNSVLDLSDHSFFVVFENDSTDGTRQRLQDWANRDKRVVVLTADTGRAKWRSVRSTARGDDMAEYRNTVRDMLASGPVRDTFDYAIAVDLDMEGVSLDGLADTFGMDAPWDAMLSNGLQSLPSRARPGTLRYVQYDAWAFRWYGAPHAPLNCKEVHPLVPGRGEPMIQVASAFGGMGVYPRASVLKSRYAGGDIEHTAFHAALDRVYMNPSQIVLYN